MKRIIILEEPAITEYDISLKAGKRLMNRFCIDEDAEFELSGVYSLHESSRAITSQIGSKAKGKVNFDEQIGGSVISGHISEHDLWYCIKTH